VYSSSPKACRNSRTVILLSTLAAASGNEMAEVLMEFPEVWGTRICLSQALFY
jgi:hypothetical protein